MDVLKFLIVEDDFYKARNLRNQIQALGYEVRAIAGSTIDAISAFNESKPDFVIMDIELPDSKEAGIELAKIFKNKDKDLIIIYYTNHIEESELMQKAIETASDGILSKKASVNELLVNINNIIRKRTLVLEDDAAIRKDDTSFWIKEGDTYNKIAFESICWMQAKNKMSYIFTDTGKNSFSSTLKYLEEKIDKRFLKRTSQSYIININKAFDLNRKYRNIKVSRTKGGAKEIPISDNYYDNIKDSLNIITTR